MRQKLVRAMTLLMLASLLACSSPSTDSGAPAEAVLTAVSTQTSTSRPTPTLWSAATDLATQTPLPSDMPTLSAEARAYLDQALDIMQEHALHRNQVDWNRLRGRAHGRASSALTPVEVYPAIMFALQSLADGHSYFLSPEQVAELESGALNAENPAPSGRLLSNGLAYLSVPAFAGTVEAGQEYAIALQQVIRELDASRPCGWVVDLTENHGGNMWPMLAGIGPVLGEGQAGAFVAPDEPETPWVYLDGQALMADEAEWGSREPGQARHLDLRLYPNCDTILPGRLPWRKMQ